MSDDTATGGPAGRFPTTRLSIVAALRSDDPLVRARSFATLVTGYWKPAYKHLRVRWRRPSEEARDLTQEFFARALEKGSLQSYDPAVARFRTFVRMCLDRFASNTRRDEKRKKRGGGAIFTTLDFDGADRELDLAPPESDLDACFDREWARHVLALATEALRAQCEAKGHAIRYQVLERYDLAPDDDARPTYAEIARGLGIPVTDVTNHLSFARKELRRLVLARLRDLTPDEAEYRAEAQALLGVRLEPPGAQPQAPAQKTPAAQLRADKPSARRR